MDAGWQSAPAPFDRETEERYGTLVDLSPDGIVVYSDGICLLANQAAARFIGVSGPDALAGRAIMDFVHPDFRDLVRARVVAMLSGATVPRVEEVFVREDGTAFDVEVASAPVTFRGRTAIMVVFRDISDRKRVERTVRRQAAELQARERILDAALRVREIEPLLDRILEEVLGLLELDMGAVLLRSGDALHTRACRGIEPDALVPSLDLSAGPPDWMRKPQVGRGSLEGTPAAVLFRARTGIACWASVPLRIPAHSGDRGDWLGLLAVASDRAEALDREWVAALHAVADEVALAIDHARAHGQTREAEARYRSIFENAVEGIYQCGPDGRILAANPALARMLGFDSAAELLDRPEDFLRRLHDEPRRREEFFVLMQAFDTVQAFEYRALRRTGEPMWVSENARAVRDAEGHVLRWEGIIEDITRRKELEVQLQQAQKMEAVGRLAGGVAHDFNNLLTAILGYSALLLDRMSEGEPARREVLEIWNAGKRASALTGQLLAFSRKQVLQPVDLDLNSIIGSIESMLRRLIGEDVELRVRPAPGIGKVRADRGQIEQVLMNLAVNSRDAMPGGGRLVIETSELTVGAAPPPDRAGLTPGRWVGLTVTDNGTGMDAATRSHLFEPFFTTKEPGKGTGLGLAVVYGIVKQSGGHIFVNSQPGQGASFSILLPRVKGDGEVAAPLESGLRQAVGGSGIVMVVEDEPAVRRLARDVLVAAGYTVLEAGNGKEALELSDAHDEPLHLLLTDVVMPGMNGRDLARRMLEARPGLRVLFTSGYTDLAVVEEALADARTAFLQKPFSPPRLTQAVRDLLDKGKGKGKG